MGPTAQEDRAGASTGWRLAGLMLAWLAGVAWQLQARALMPVGLYVALAVVSVVACGVAWRWRRLFLAGCLGLCCLGWSLSGWHASVRVAQSLPAALEGRDIQLTGVVSSLPRQGPTGLRFHLDVEAATLDGAPVALPPRISLGWYVGWHPGAELTPQQRSLRAGQRWRMNVRLRQPHGHMNPHGFDHELYLFEQGVRATGHVRDASAQLLDLQAGHWVQQWRQWVRDAIQATVPDARPAGVLAGLSVGDQSAIDRDDWDLFRTTGIAHLVSISGLHVTMFAWAAGGLIGWLWRRSPQAMLWAATPLAARVGGLGAALAYAVFSGWGVPAQRTVWMLVTVTLLQVSGRHWPWPLVLAAAACVVTAIDPWALLQPGFWLSFMAVALLMASSSVSGGLSVSPPHATGWRAGLVLMRQGAQSGLRTQMVATVGLTPLTLVFFQQVSLVGFVANLLAIPLVTLLITPLALLGTLWAPLWTGAAWLVSRLTDFLTWLASFPVAVWQVPVAPGWAQGVGLMAAALLVAPWSWRLRLLAVPLMVPLLLPPRDWPPPGSFEVLAVDVGQGTAVLVRTQHHLMLYDAGPQYSPESDAGQRVLVPLLRARGDTRIDRLVLSHRDTDHVGGAQAVLLQMRVGEMLSSIEPLHPLQGVSRLRGVPSRRCEAGQSWQWDGVTFAVLHPAAEDFERPLKSNGISCVIRVSDAAGRSLLLTGDIERQQELELLDSQGDALRSDVLVVPHHGSTTSSSAPFLDAVQPQAAVVQVGFRNRFGHPAGPVVQRYAGRQIPLYDSPRCGAWHWRSNMPLDSATCQRDVARRVWHANLDSP